LTQGRSEIEERGRPGKGMVRREREREKERGKENRCAGVR